MNIEAMKKELFEYMVKNYNEYLANKTVEKYKIKYLTIYSIYYEVDELKDENSIRSYIHNLFNMSKTLKVEYDKLYFKFSNETNPTLKASYLTMLNECAAKLNAYNESYNIINRHLNKKAPSKKEEPKKDQPKKELVKKEVKPKEEQLTNDDTAISNKIIELLTECNELDKNTSEAKKKLTEVYKLRVDRENKFKRLYGDKYRVFVSEIESYENMASMLPSERFKPRELDSNNYILELRTAINAINEYFFIPNLQIKKYYKKDNNVSDGLNDNRNLKKYNNFLRKYHVLITSLFNSREVSFNVDGVSVSTEDLLAYLGTCNLDGDFSVYKSKFNGSMIGVEETNKKKYLETLTFLNKCINSLCELVRSKFKTEKITIIDKEITKQDIIKKRDNKLKEIYYLKQEGKLDSKESAYERK